MKISKSCQICNKIFYIYKNRIKNARFCSRKCRGKEQAILLKKRIKVNCSTCNKELELVPSRRKNYNKNYCSRRCQHKGMLNGINKRCITCNKIFYVERCRSKAIFCSALCSNLVNDKGKFKKGHIGWNKGKRLVEYVNISCLYCGKKFESPKSDRRKFCSMKCKNKVIKPMLGRRLSSEHKRKFLEGRDKFYREHPERTPTWNGGSSYIPYGKYFRPLREKIRIRDERKCALCSMKENGEKLACHHIDYDKSNYSQNNLISLCRSCHAKTNVNRNYWNIYCQNKMEVLYGFKY